MTHWMILPSNVFNSREGVFKTLENWKILNLWVVINKKVAIFGISSPAHTFNPDSLPDLALNASFKLGNSSQIPKNLLETLVQGASACKRLACEQALRGALAAGREEGEALSTTSLEFEYLHGKRRCEMMIGEYDISNDVITLGTRRVNICLHSRSLPPCADWRKSDSTERLGN